jgi:hypothetical protein
MRNMRVSHWWCALLLLGAAHPAWAADQPKAAKDDEATMEIIEMLGEIDDDGTDLEIAMSDTKIDERDSVQEVKKDE